MATAKNKRKKRLSEILITVVVLVLILALKPIFIDKKQEENSFNDLSQNNVTQDQKREERPTEEVSGNIMLYMIDVGQADSFLFVQRDNVALVDCGTRSTGKDAVEYIKNLGITKIDYVFGTHPHDDHMGGMYDIITSFEVGKIILPKVETGQVTTNWYIKLMKEISEGNYQVEYSQTGNIYQLGDATIEVLWQAEEPQSNINNYSSIMKVSFGEMDILMTGDAETEIEAEALNSKIDLDAEILKIGHHGSDTSSSQEFLDAVDPDYGLISSKLGNKYNHPTETTMNNLENMEVIVYRTDECGSVVATITANDITFDCEPGDYLSGPELEEKVA